MSQFTEEEIIKLKQLVCDHQQVNDPHACTCCGDYDGVCRICNKRLEHECNDHDTDDGYCEACR